VGEVVVVRAHLVLRFVLLTVKLKVLVPHNSGNVEPEIEGVIAVNFNFHQEISAQTKPGLRCDN